MFPSGGIGATFQVAFTTFEVAFYDFWLAAIKKAPIINTMDAFFHFFVFF